MHVAKLTSLAVLFLCASMISEARLASPGPGSKQTAAELVRSLAECVRRRWVGPPADQPASGTPRYEECWDLLQKLSGIPADEAVRLVREEDLNLVESHLVEIAMALRERPTAWPALEAYYDMAISVRGGGRTLRGAVSPRPMEAHLRHEFIHAWRWMMLCPEAYDTKMARTGATALAQMNDTASLELMAVVFQWSFDAGRDSGLWVRDALAAYPEDSRSEALRLASRCWRYARSVASEEVPQDSAHPRTVDEDEPQRVLKGMAAIFPKDSVRKALENGEKDAEFLQFLEQVRAVQTHESE